MSSNNMNGNFGSSHVNKYDTEVISKDYSEGNSNQSSLADNLVSVNHVSYEDDTSALESSYETADEGTVSMEDLDETMVKKPIDCNASEETTESSYETADEGTVSMEDLDETMVKKPIDCNASEETTVKRPIDCNNSEDIDDTQLYEDTIDEDDSTSFMSDKGDFFNQQGRVSDAESAKEPINSELQVKPASSIPKKFSVQVKAKYEDLQMINIFLDFVKFSDSNKLPNQLEDVNDKSILAVQCNNKEHYTVDLLYNITQKNGENKAFSVYPNTDNIFTNEDVKHAKLKKMMRKLVNDPELVQKAEKKKKSLISELQKLQEDSTKFNNEFWSQQFPENVDEVYLTKLYSILNVTLDAQDIDDKNLFLRRNNHQNNLPIEAHARQKGSIADDEDDENDENDDAGFEITAGRPNNQFLDIDDEQERKKKSENTQDESDV